MAVSLRFRASLSLLGLTVLGGLLLAESPAGREPADLAGSIWAVIELVQQNHFEPPKLPEMVLNAGKTVFLVTKKKAPDNLATSAAAVTTEAELRNFLKEIWPKVLAEQSAKAPKVETVILDRFIRTLPGQCRLLPADTIKIQDQLGGNRYVGIGIKVKLDDASKCTQILMPIRGGTAQKGGARAGDLIVEVDGKKTAGIELAKVIDWLRGPENTTVTIVVHQPGAPEARTLKLVRSVVPFDSVYGFQRGPGNAWNYMVDAEAKIAYAWVQSIKISTVHELRQVERILQAEGARAVVLDFRQSMGDGQINHAGLLADSLLDGGTMFAIRTTGNKVREMKADGDCLFRGLPMAVLINDVPDGAQGAVLAALQDNRRAVLIGQPTKSDGVVRSLFSLPGDDGVVSIQTGRIERAAKDKTWPVQPDHLVELSKAQRVALEKWYADKELTELPPGADDRPPPDPQLNRALELLREALAKKAAG
jgi:carboxyl-terminal processing protease